MKKKKFQEIQNPRLLKPTKSKGFHLDNCHEFGQQQLRDDLKAVTNEYAFNKKEWFGDMYKLFPQNP